LGNGNAFVTRFLAESGDPTLRGSAGVNSLGDIGEIEGPDDGDFVAIDLDIGD
jgi:hypothetical protein